MVKVCCNYLVGWAIYVGCWDFIVCSPNQYHTPELANHIARSISANRRCNFRSRFFVRILNREEKEWAIITRLVIMVSIAPAETLAGEMQWLLSASMLL